MHDDPAKAPAPRQEVQEAGVRATGRASGSQLLVPVPHAQELQVVLVVERDGVLRPPAGVDTAGLHIESQAPVGIDAVREIRHADDHVVDAGEHDPPSGARFAATF